MRAFWEPMRVMRECGGYEGDEKVYEGYEGDERAMRVMRECWFLSSVLIISIDCYMDFQNYLFCFT